MNDRPLNDTAPVWVAQAAGDSGQTLVSNNSMIAQPPPPVNDLFSEAQRLFAEAESVKHHDRALYWRLRRAGLLMQADALRVEVQR